MLKIFIVFISVLLAIVVNGQTISNKEAIKILDKAWSCLQTSDSVSFVNLWRHGDFASSPEQASVRRQAMDNFHFMRQFLDTALVWNLRIHDIKIQEESLKGTDATHWIKAWFQYSEHDYKGFGFYVAHKNDKWIVRGNPSTSSMKRDVK